VQRQTGRERHFRGILQVRRRHHLMHILCNTRPSSRHTEFLATIESVRGKLQAHSFETAHTNSRQIKDHACRLHITIRLSHSRSRRPQRLQKSNTTNVLEQRLYQGLQLSRSINVYGQEGCCIDQRETRIKYELGRVA
jgi:hypothetical protein